MRCQRCNEAGHSTQFCSVDKLSLSAVKPMSERNMKDSSAKRNKTFEATNVIAAEKAASRPADQSEHIVKCGPSHNPMCRPKDLLSTSFGHVKKPSQLYGQTNEQDMRNTSSNKASTDGSKLKPNECQTVSVKTGRLVDGSLTMPDALMDKSSTVPELDFIWQ
ncbi:Os12g0433200 [Oryza sativa Japonica Group]|uniref:Os12g0433200 protein n=3 Tax=Oryza sativa subsp. japonica TaxID=39947 RepID=Q0INL4_ORYSJ|nr:Os12g0433200 [Oryza sativa Japonica Group]BAT16956.1 Os12g0433200 [Oryza sativa Japonica Group]|eukprot:NP_001066682.1 Os12g0433200 [Oryza sativa Japonica Group]